MAAFPIPPHVFRPIHAAIAKGAFAQGSARVNFMCAVHEEFAFGAGCSAREPRNGPTVAPIGRC